MFPWTPVRLAESKRNEKQDIGRTGNGNGRTLISFKIDSVIKTKIGTTIGSAFKEIYGTDADLIATFTRTYQPDR